MDQSPNAKLIFRYNPDVKFLGMTTDDEKLRLVQTDEDLDR
jgi:hypothetical protein